MKRFFAAVLCIALALSLCACGTVKESVEMLYGTQTTLENEVFDKYDEVAWESSNSTVAEVKSGRVSAKAPGEATVTASANGKQIAIYTVTVNIKEITSIVLSTNNLELTEGESQSVGYTLLPSDASDYGLSWSSADPSVAAVDENGEITAVSPGQTSIILSNASGVAASMTVTVKLKPAYDRLSEEERTFVDAMMSNIYKFKDPSSVKILAIQPLGTTWYVSISAKNSYGGTNSKTYWMMDGLITDLDTSVKHDSNYDLSLINEAINDLRG